MTFGLDLITAYFVAAIGGSILCVYWGFTVSQDPAALHVPHALNVARRACILGIGAGMLMSVAFGYERTWEPWPPFVAIICCLDLYIVVSIIGATIRRDICARCPLLPEQVRAELPGYKRVVTH